MIRSVNFKVGFPCRSWSFQLKVNLQRSGSLAHLEILSENFSRSLASPSFFGPIDLASFPDFEPASAPFKPVPGEAGAVVVVRGREVEDLADDKHGGMKNH